VPHEQIAREIGIPANYLSKILNQLRKSGFVESRKGWGGGSRLRPDAFGRPLIDVVRVFEGDRSEGIPACIFGLPECDDGHPCALHGSWVGIRDAFSAMLTTTTIGDLKSRRFESGSCKPGAAGACSEPGV
jgi:Rrf2 family transcriptional regulator, iron-sulfur cluster assembly transcription factor